jgi:hypothetical protein
VTRSRTEPFTNSSLIDCAALRSLLVLAAGRKPTRKASRGKRRTSCSANSSGGISSDDISNGSSSSVHDSVQHFPNLGPPFDYVDWLLQNSGCITRRQTVNSKAEPVRSTTFTTAAAAHATAREQTLGTYKHKQWGLKAAVPKVRRAAMSNAAAAAQLDGARKR